MPRKDQRQNAPKISRRASGKNLKNEQRDVQPSCNPIKSGEQSAASSSALPGTSSQARAGAMPGAEAGGSELTAMAAEVRRGKRFSKLVKAYSGRGISNAEIEDIADQAVCHAMWEYDPSKGCPFGCFAMKQIRWRLADRFGELSELPASARKLVKEFDRTKKELEDRLGHRCTDQDTYDDLAWDADTLERHASARRFRSSQSIHYPMSCDNQDCVDPIVVDVEDDGEELKPARRLMNNETAEGVQRGLLVLTPDERRVIRLIYMLRKPLSVAMIASRLKWSDYRVKKERDSALGKLKKKLSYLQN